MSEVSANSVYRESCVEYFIGGTHPDRLPPRIQLITIELPVGVPHRDIFRALGAIIQLGGKIVDLGDRQ